jgi:putative ABC transport system substrate-binding protein
MGLVDSINRPGGNITGITSMSAEILAKRLELLHKMVPQARRIALLVIAITPGTELLIKRTQAAAASIGLQLEVLTASTDREIDAAFNNLIEKQVDALLVQPTALFYDRRVQIITLAARHAVPASYFTAGFVDVGGLMSYGPKSYDELTYQGGVYVGRILKGEKAGDLPVMRPTRFEFVINAQTARTIGLTIAPDVLSIADEVIE